MEKRLRTAMLLLFLPIVIVFIFVISKQFFDISLNNEIESLNKLQQLISQDVKRNLLSEKNYESLVTKARECEKQHSNKAITVKILYGGKFITNDTLPSYLGDMIKPQKCAMVYTKGRIPLLIIVEPIGNKLSLVLQKDIDHIYKQKQQVNKKGIMASFILLVVIFVISWGLSKKHTKPIKKLTLAAKEIADGNNDVEMPAENKYEIGELSLAFKKMQSSIINREEKLKFELINKQNLLNGLAHEMRTPICSILGNARLIQSIDMSKEDVNNALESICKEAKLLSVMDKQLMDIIDTGDNIQKEDVSVLELFKIAKERLLIQEPYAKIEIIGEDHFIHANKDMMLILLSNLLSNAVKASNAGNKIILQTLQNGFIVQDFGMGMSKEDTEHAFEAFYKADKSRARKHGGMGLGLSICKQIAKKHNANIIIKSKVNEGTQLIYTQM